MIIVDGRTALVGGRNFADHYREDDWRDVDLVIDGPSVTPLAALFEAVWAGRASERASTPLPWVDSVPRDIVTDPIVCGVLSAIGQARRRVDLELAYFVAHESLCGALARALGRGVRVRLLTNSAESNDLPYTTWAAYDGARRLLEAGGEVHARRGAGRTLHSKYVVIDEDWVSFGSHNLDYYSPRYCCETHLVVRDAPLAALLTAFFESGVAEATPLLLEEEVRPFLQRERVRRAFDRVFHDFQ
jgi:cardiolipin synthase